MISPIDFNDTDILEKMLISHTYRELLAVIRYNDVLEFTPQKYTDYIKHTIAEEQEHYEECIKVAINLGLNLESKILDRLGRQPVGIPLLKDWGDFVLAHAFNDTAGIYIFEGIVGTKIKPYGDCCQKILTEEKGHSEKGRELLLEHFSSYPIDNTKIKMHLEAAYRCLGKPDSLLDKQAVQHRLKVRSAKDTIAAYSTYANNLLREIKYEQ